MHIHIPVGHLHIYVRLQLVEFYLNIHSTALKINLFCRIYVFYMVMDMPMPHFAISYCIPDIVILALYINRENEIPEQYFM